MKLLLAEIKHYIQEYYMPIIGTSFEIYKEGVGAKGFYNTLKIAKEANSSKDTILFHLYLFGQDINYGFKVF